MALPTSPSTTYIPNNVPAIKAQDLNDLQQYLAGIYSGLYTVKTLYANGVGGTALTQLPGLVVANGLVTHTTLPNTVNYAAGTVAQGTVARAWAWVHADGSFERGFKVTSTGRTAMGNPAGDYTVVFDTSPSDKVHVAVFASIVELRFAPCDIQVLAFDSGGKQGLRVFTFLGSSQTDLQFSVGIFAE